MMMDRRLPKTRPIGKMTSLPMLNSRSMTWSCTRRIYRKKNRLLLLRRIKAHRPASQMAVSQAPVIPPAAFMTPKLPVASLPSRLEDDHPPQMLTVILRPSGDSQRDIRRISRLHGTFISYPGKDRFAFQIFEEGRGHLIEFPNDTTHLCAELLTRLKDAVGEENLRVEPILYL